MLLIIRDGCVCAVRVSLLTTPFKNDLLLSQSTFKIAPPIIVHVIKIKHKILTNTYFLQS